MTSNQKGFSTAETLLILVIVAVIGGVGYYVYKARQETSKSQDNANKSSLEIEASKKQSEEDKKAPEETASWLLYEPPGKQYSVRIPDGWKLVSLSGTDLYGRNSSDTVYKAGTKATVQAIEGGWDGASSFGLYYPSASDEPRVKEGEQKGTLTTASGLTAQKYQYTQTTEPEGIGYAKGSTVYNYYFDDKGKNIFIQHYVSSGETAQTDLVEKAIKTLKVK